VLHFGNHAALDSGFPDPNRISQWRFWGLHLGGSSGVAITGAGGTDAELYCHSEPPLTSGKLCFIITFIGGHRGARIFTGGAAALSGPL